MANIICPKKLKVILPYPDPSSHTHTHIKARQRAQPGVNTLWTTCCRAFKTRLMCVFVPAVRSVWFTIFGGAFSSAGFYVLHFSQFLENDSQNANTKEWRDHFESPHPQKGCPCWWEGRGYGRLRTWGSVFCRLHDAPVSTMRIERRTSDWLWHLPVTWQPPPSSALKYDLGFIQMWYLCVIFLCRCSPTWSVAARWI